MWNAGSLSPLEPVTLQNFVRTEGVKREDENRQ